MYVTQYSSKNTQDEDNEKFGKAAVSMIKSMNDRLQESNGNEDNAVDGDSSDDDGESQNPMADEDNVAIGMRTMIGAVFAATNAHKCSAPMAAYLTRNTSRFHFSHETVYTRLEDFMGIDINQTFDMGADTDGNVFIKSHVANYVLRNNKLKEYCLYDILQNFGVSRPCKKSYDWEGIHPNNNTLKMVAYEKKKRIPLINYKDFPNVSQFEGEDLLTCQIPDEKEAKHYAMEEYAKKACIVFVPFRNFSDLQIEGSFVKRFQNHVSDGKLTQQHQKILQNLQDCKDSLNAGRPKDALERETQSPVNADDEGRTCSQEMSESERAFEEAMSNMFDNEAAMDSFDFPTYRNTQGQFDLDSNICRSEGTHKCGEKLIAKISTDFSNAPNVGVQHTTETTPTFPEESRNATNEVTSEMLHDLAMRVVERVTDTETGKNVPIATGTLANIREYADAMFHSDDDQKIAFESIVAAFLLSLYNEARKFDPEADNMSRQKILKLNSVKKDLERVNRGAQLICFLSGAGGTGKSHVILSVIKYSKSFCDNLGIEYTSQTILVTALTGAAAVAVRGQTVHTAVSFFSEPTQSMIDSFKNTYMVFVDEISFANKGNLVLLDKRLKKLKEQYGLNFGGIHVVFAGDFSQLRPPQSRPLFLEKPLPIWDDLVHTFFELRTNHRFSNDPGWGQLLERYRDTGPTNEDIDLINSRVVGSANGPSVSDIPCDVTYATRTNKDRMAINDGIFLEHLSSTHSKDPNITPPRHTICVKCSELAWRKGKNQFAAMNNRMKDFFHATIGEAHVVEAGSTKGTKSYDPLLKLYHHRPIMITDNIDVPNGLSNGTMCKFLGVTFKDGVGYDDLEKIRIDGYYVWCVNIVQLLAMRVQILDGLFSAEEVKIATIHPKRFNVKAEIPIPVDGPVTKHTHRRFRRCRFRTFPINIANARTIHKLQGRSLEHVVISSWQYRDNWIYVALSRVRTLDGLYLRVPLNQSGCKPMSNEIRVFMDKLRKKRPKARVTLYEEEYDT